MKIKQYPCNLTNQQRRNIDMKKLITILTLSLVSTAALAHTGAHRLTCASAKNSGSKQKVEFQLSRANSAGLIAPVYSVTIDGKKTEYTTDDDMKTLGNTINQAPLGVINITATNYIEEEAPVRGEFSITAIPSTVKAYNADGRRVRWSFEGEKDSCNYANGKAKFQGIFHGIMTNKNANGEDISTPADTQIMNCVLEYNSGMAC